MKTEIFTNKTEFLNRKDKETNGVSHEFAENHKNYEEDNLTNSGCWNCYNCSDCYNCYYCHGCLVCSECSGCLGCSDCSACSECSVCFDCFNKKQDEQVIPEIKNIHQTVLKATNGKNSLNMDDWRTCETTHCRAGWVVHLAGEAGYALEKRTSTPFAAMQIYKKSSDIKVSPEKFYDSNDGALADMKRCAKEELKLSQ